MRGDPVVWRVLQEHERGHKVTLRDGKAVAEAVAAMRAEFLNDVYQAMQNPGSLDPGAIPCMAVMGKLLEKHGIISSAEMESLIKGFGMMTG